MKSVYFVRHGQTLWNVENKICGATDIPLTELGHSQAVETGKRILEEGIQADEILYSPLVRAAETARHSSESTGIPGREVDAAGRKVIAHPGYGPYFSHSLGHSLGVDIHESPNASPSEKAPLPAGAVVSAEPGIYLPGRFGVRIEDVLVYREGGCEDITRSPKELIVL